MRRMVALSVSIYRCSCVVAAQDRAYGRSMVITDHGIVATSHYLASQAGAQILAKGGSAMDSAIAANNVRGVEPKRTRLYPAKGLFRGDGTGPGCTAQLENRNELWRFGPPGRRRG